MDVVLVHKSQREIETLETLLPRFNFFNAVPQDNIQILIRWGNTDGEDKGRLVLNTKDALVRAIDAKRALSYWQINGVRCPKAFYSKKPLKKMAIPVTGGYLVTAVSFVRRYTVYIFDLQVLSIIRKMDGQVVETPFQNPFSPNYGPDMALPTQHKEWEKVCTMATRAIYALGLHFGAVDIGVDKSGKAYALQIEPAPRLTRFVARTMANAFQAYILRFIRKEEFARSMTVLTMGADPEFMLRNKVTKQMILASNFFPFSGIVGCDQRSMLGQRRQHPLAELRPAPAKEPMELFSNLQKAMAMAIKLAPFYNVEWVAGSEPFPGYQIGGHIHFGGIRVTTDLLSALDNYLAIPVMLLENPESARKRRKKYGFLGDYRIQSYGGFEYRALACWLVSPRLTRAVLSLAYLVATNYLKLSKDWLADARLRLKFKEADKAVFYLVFQEIWQEISALPQFPKYKEMLEPMAKMISEKKRWRENVDIRETWNMPLPTRVYYG
ncbi:MAG: putative amidoligase domain-containing protein [Thermincolia bacterium]